MVDNNGLEKPSPFGTRNLPHRQGQRVLEVSTLQNFSEVPRQKYSLLAIEDEDIQQVGMLRLSSEIGGNSP